MPRGDQPILKGVEPDDSGQEKIHAVMGRNGSGQKHPLQRCCGHPPTQLRWIGRYRGQDLLEPSRAAGPIGLFLVSSIPIEIPAKQFEFSRVATKPAAASWPKKTLTRSP